MEKRISGTTGLFTLLGSPVGHSGSPAMYNFSFQEQGLDYAYLAFDVKKAQMPEAIDALRLFKVRGSNVTMPCKGVAATLVDELSPAAMIVGASFFPTLILCAYLCIAIVRLINVKLGYFDKLDRMSREEKIAFFKLDKEV